MTYTGPRPICSLTHQPGKAIIGSALICFPTALVKKVGQALRLGNQIGRWGSNTSNQETE